jgi:hypothetical protein
MSQQAAHSPHIAPPLYGLSLTSQCPQVHVASTLDGRRHRPTDQKFLGSLCEYRVHKWKGAPLLSSLTYSTHQGQCADSRGRRP